MAKVNKALIVTVYNEEKTIKRLLDSILIQTEKPKQVVIVDGGSQDNTVGKIREYGNKFEVYIKKGNRSIGRNEAIKRTSAEIIAITDAGCILDKDWFKNITSVFGKNVDVAAGFYKARTDSIFEKCLVPYVLVMPDRLNPKTFLPATRSMALKKSVWNELKGFDPKLSNNEDYAFAKKIQRGRFEIRFVRSAIVYWIPRANFLQAFNMFYRFAKGDSEAKIFRPKVFLIFARYIIMLILLFHFIENRQLLILLTLISLFILYLIWSISKNYKYVKKAKAIIYLPLIQLISDFAVIMGTLRGLI